MEVATWAPLPNKPTVSVDVKATLQQLKVLELGDCYCVFSPLVISSVLVFFNS